MIGLHHVFMSLTPTSQHLRSAVPRCSTGLSCFGVAACLPCGRWANWIEVQLAVQLGYWDEQVTQCLLKYVKTFWNITLPMKKGLWQLMICYHRFPHSNCHNLGGNLLFTSTKHHNNLHPPTPACPPATLTASRTPWRCSPAFRGLCGYTWVVQRPKRYHPHWELPDIMWI